MTPLYQLKMKRDVEEVQDAEGKKAGVVSSTSRGARSPWWDVSLTHWPSTVPPCCSARLTLAQAAQLAADSPHESMRPCLGEAQRLDHMTPTQQDNEVTSSYIPDS